MRLAILWLLASCASARTAEPARAPTPWCLRAEVRVYGLVEVCTTSRRLCEHARSQAIAFSGIAGVDTIGVCR